MPADTTTAPLGLRERKRLETRTAISRAAAELFLRDGFHNVSVGEVAKVADVSKVTVFNYFPTKEDLALAPLAEHTGDEVRAVRERPAAPRPWLPCATPSCVTSPPTRPRRACTRPPPRWSG